MKSFQSQFCRALDGLLNAKKVFSKLFLLRWKLQKTNVTLWHSFLSTNAEALNMVREIWFLYVLDFSVQLIVLRKNEINTSTWTLTRDAVSWKLYKSLWIIFSYKSQTWIGHLVENEILHRKICSLAFFRKLSWLENPKYHFWKV